jgi:hypothetical protein
MLTKKPKGDVEIEGRLRFHAAEMTTVVASTPKGTFKLFKVVFGKKDGSVYVPFPYLSEKRGILAEADPSSEPDPKTIDLKRGGVVVDFDTKFTHHTSGLVHFSKSGEQEILPGRRGFPLTGPIGRLFEFRAYGLEGFEAVDLSRPTKDYRLRLQFQHHPRSIVVWSEWRRKKDILDNTDDNTAPIGPSLTVTRRSDGFTWPCQLLGQPRGFPLREHVLMISAEETPYATGAGSPTAIFVGGWDVHEGTRPNTAKMLAFMYPFLGQDPAMSDTVGKLGHVEGVA